MSREYDFAAADRISRELSRLIAKLDWFIWLRTTRRKALLGTPHSDNWQGAKRREFEKEYARQQAAFAHLRETASTLQASISSATEAAHAAQKKHEG
ncbi:hypothetical protein J2Z21_000502 [Streptomyces griseochromogenes]|uniref:Uncharacterized protein n=1 Tax=Streptomyces griseochromogenes TaxID=68214 RepID=A0A1B1B292_9ACTN|nr:hypothetical protein [Streptomyces griseochromogenes]ANP52937.1 hypothetical protein AVL59_28365 [Streptomyces griseochromogenes]MBP2047580.1 hypothetical protein [Streptomyces griseochromogenes]